MFANRRPLVSKRNTESLIVMDVFEYAPGIMGVSSYTDDLLDNCVHMAKKITDEYVVDFKAMDVKKPAHYLDKISTLGVSAGGLTLHTLPALSEKLTGKKIKSTNFLFHPGDKETTNLTMDIVVEKEIDYSDDFNSMVRLLVQGHIDNYVYSKNRHNPK